MASLVCISGCSSATKSGTQAAQFEERTDDAGAEVTQIELQETLQRFSAQFIEKMAESTHDWTQENMRDLLNYASSLLDIASGPYPEVNLLDMLVFIRLSRWALERHGGHALWLDAFRVAEQDLMKTEAKVLKPEQISVLNKLIADWQAQNLDRTRVEWVRLSQFATQAGASAKRQAEEASGLLSGVKSAVATGDQALLLANRAMFLAHRMPFLIRMQARLGATEITKDIFSELAQGRRLASAAGGIQPLIRDFSTLTLQAAALSRQLDSSMRYFRERFPRDPNYRLSDKLLLAERVINGSSSLLERLNHMATRDPLGRFVWQIAVAALAVGMGWILAFWSGYYFVRRRYHAVSRPAASKEAND